jgi:hypothetical protein
MGGAVEPRYIGINLERDGTLFPIASPLWCEIYHGELTLAITAEPRSLANREPCATIVVASRLHVVHVAAPRLRVTHTADTLLPHFATVARTCP